jgi:hypothetical protein
MTPAEVIANVLHHVEGEGLDDEQALALAGDVLHALAVAGMAVVSAEDLDDALAALIEREDVCFGGDCSDVHCQRVLRLRAALPEKAET